jgi:hypothetical protein
MDETLTVECPGCHSVLVVDRRTGKVLETRKPIREESSGDRLDDAFKNVNERASKLEQKMKAIQEAEKSKRAKLDNLFKEGLDRAKESGESGAPRSPFDLD